MLHVGEDDACNGHRVVRARLTVEADRVVEPLFERRGSEPGAVRDRGRKRRIGAPFDRPPLLIECRIFGRLQLFLGGLGLVDGFQNDRADAGLERTPHALLVDEMIGRPGDDRVAQHGAAHCGDECVHASSAFNPCVVESHCGAMLRTVNNSEETPCARARHLFSRLHSARCFSLRSTQAQTWPSRPVTVVVPFLAGTTGDIVARGLVEHLASALGQPFIVDNRAGAGGNIGGAAVAKAAPDGYTLLLATTGPAANNKFMYKNMPYDPQRDFAPIVLMGKSPVIITAKNSLPATTLKELVEYAKANPGKITAGYPGNGTFGHVTGELLQQSAGMTFVPAQYRGSPAIITDLLGGHIDIGMDSMAPYVR